ncbi:MAG: hypothetical protein ABF755_07090 [Oenococcus oeni]|uniref:hypothetical protein n=1 Tax=Oenococcus oeni TaxID=1247 RepID=UPI0008F82961|nr:hypothetical protein [Oenococcus oeni]OIM22375.1 hypothetical protein ATX60_09825 [Oenococcus oeni]SYW00346.1 conserved hypothetical protein [Oenococcus oeni]
MENKQIKKPINAKSEQTNSINGHQNQDTKQRIYVHSNQKTNSSQAEGSTNDKYVNTHYFDREQYKDMPERLRRTGNAIGFGQSKIRTADKIVAQLGIPVRNFRDNVENLRANYTVPIIGKAHQPNGFYIATNVLETEPYLRQQKAREDRGAKARHGVEQGLKNGFLDELRDWQARFEHD